MPTLTSPTVPGLEDDDVGTRVVEEEQRLLAAVLEALDAASRRGSPTDEDDRRLLELRDDVASAKPEDLPALFEQMHHLGALKAQRGKGIAVPIDRLSPYFGHLRLEEHGRRRDVLIGGRSYIAPEVGIRVADWRHAPVSRIYYRYAQGDDYEEELGDRLVEGVVVARRGVTIRAGEVVRVAAPEGTFVRLPTGQWRRLETFASRLVTERTWKHRLGVDAGGELRQDKHLPSIAALLDPAQFELITRPTSGLVVVQGTAGSGKTTVGLHRVAYLAFADPDRFRPDRMMVVVPHDGLVHYVKHVLPSLGIEGVVVTTFARWSARVVAPLFPRLPVAIHDETPPVVARFKSSPAMLRAIDRAVRRLTVRTDERLREAMGRWPEGDQVLRAWKGTGNAGFALDARLTMLVQWLGRKRTLPGVAVPEGVPDVTRGAFERMVHELRESTRSVSAIWDELLTSREGLAEAFPNVARGQIEQVHDWCVRQTRVRAEGERDGEGPTLDAEDPALLLRIWQRLRGPLLDSEGRPLRVAHMFLDEVQGASPVELRVLLDLVGQDRSVTLAGDGAQRMLEEDDEGGEFDWAKLLDDLGIEHTTVEPLKVSYRSTAEITRFARGVLGPLAHEAEPIASRSGPPVELFTFASAGEAVAWLADALKELANEAPEANVALISRFGVQADVYYDGLVRAEVPRLRRVLNLDFEWEAGVDVTDVRQTRGLEFDDVVLLDANASSYPLTSQARHAMYVGATRAAHQLWCVASETPSELVTGALAL